MTSTSATASESQERYYQGPYHASVHEHLIENDEYFYSRARAALETYMAHLPTTVQLAEYGCGIGQNIAHFPNAIGFDVSESALREATRRGLRVTGNLADLSPGGFAVVLSRHSLEHVPAPFEALLNMHRLLAPDGELILILPREKHCRTPFAPDIHQHLYCWNFRTINNLLNAAGFTVEGNRYNYDLGFRALLPVKRLCGWRAYRAAVKLTGALLRNGELVITARKR